MSGINTGANPPISLDFLQQIIAVSWGGAWLLVNMSATGSNPNPPAPPYGSFAFTPPPKGTSLLDQQQITKTSGSVTVPDDYYFPWNTLVSPPTVDNYKIIRPDHPGNQLFSWSVEDTLRGYPNDPSFPPPDKLFWYSTAAKAAATLPILPGISDEDYFASLTDFLSITFTNNFPNPLAWTVQVVHDKTTVNRTILTTQFLFLVPTAASTLNFTVTAPSGGASGWASIFTPPQKNIIKKISDLSGNADQSVASFLGGASHTFSIQTTGKPGHGTVSVDGVHGTSPGLPPTGPTGG